MFPSEAVDLTSLIPYPVYLKVRFAVVSLLKVATLGESQGA
jgi:hypothetical protein